MAFEAYSAHTCPIRLHTSDADFAFPGAAQAVLDKHELIRQPTSDRPTRATIQERRYHCWTHSVAEAAEFRALSRYRFEFDCRLGSRGQRKEDRLRALLIQHPGLETLRHLPVPTKPVVVTNRKDLIGTEWEEGANDNELWAINKPLKLVYMGPNKQPEMYAYDEARKETRQTNGPILISVQSHPATHRLATADEQKYYRPKTANGKYTRFNVMWKQARKWITTVVTRDTGQEALQRRLETWRRHSKAAAAAMEREEYTEVWAAASGLSSRDRFVRYRVKIGGLNTFRADLTEQPYCPLAGCGAHERDHLAHILWRCATAKRIWRQAAQLWTHNTLTATDLQEYEEAAFAGQPTRLSKAAKAWLLTHTRKLLPGHRAAMATAWRIIRVTVQKQLWRYRCDEVFDKRQRTIFEKIAVTMERIEEELHIRERAAQEKRDHDGRLIYKMLIGELERAETTADTQHETATDTSARLYFDGGSRGNPGVAGAGAVLLTYTAAGWQAAWYGTRFLGDTASNNNAEYNALLLGLRAAKTAGLQKIDVFGDPQLVSNQLSGKAAVRDAKLTPFFTEARELLEDVDHLHHHTHLSRVEHHVRLSRKPSHGHSAKPRERELRRLRHHAAGSRANDARPAVQAAVRSQVERRSQGSSMPTVR